MKFFWAYYCRYRYYYPFLDTKGLVTANDIVKPIYQHVFPPSLAPSLSFVGLPHKVTLSWIQFYVFLGLNFFIVWQMTLILNSWFPTIFFVSCKWYAYPNNKFRVNHATHMKEGSTLIQWFCFGRTISGSQLCSSCRLGLCWNGF
jgi:hypothetical protein